MTSLHYYSSGPRALLSSLGKSICKQIVLCPASVDKVTFFSLLSTTKCFCVYKTNMANFTLKLKKNVFRTTSELRSEEAFRHKNVLFFQGLYFAILTFPSKSSILLRLQKEAARESEAKTNFLAPATWP